MDNKSQVETEKRIQNNSELLGQNIRKKRIEQNISQEYLAEILDLSRQSISKWENGLTEPSTKNLAKLASIFKCDIAELLPREEKADKGGPFGIIGIVVDSCDIKKMKFFFQEFPLDTMKHYSTSLVIMYNGDDNHLGMIADTVELYIGICSVIAKPEDVPEYTPNHIYLVSKDVYGKTIDEFYEALVQTCGKNTVAVLMSDFGDEGVKGLRYVKSSGGMSVICESIGGDNRWNSSSEGYFDYVLEPVCMGYWISTFIRKAWFESTEKYKGVFAQRFHHRMEDCLQEVCTYSFSDFREEYLFQSIYDRMEETEAYSADYYVRLLEKSHQEQVSLSNKILYNVCKPEKSWMQIMEVKELFPELKPQINGIRIWIPGCGDGLEAYVTAMLLADYLEGYRWNDKIKIFATDMDEGIISTAVQGHFSQRDIEAFPDKWKDNYLRATDNGYQIVQSIRNMVTFSVHDILHHPPFARIDLLICRNVLKKYRIRSRKVILSRFSYSLVEKGYLVLNQNEDIAELHNWFEHIPKYNGRIWLKLHNAPRSFGTWLPNRESFSVDKVVQEMLACSFTSCVIIDEMYEIIYTGNEAGRYLKFKSGIFSKNLFDNIDLKLRVFLEAAIHHIKDGGEYRDVLMRKDTDGKPQNINITVRCHIIRERMYYIIIFSEQKTPEQTEHITTRREKKLEQELEISQQRLVKALEELEETKDNYGIINEKLQSTNEELILMNDELQMVNQELSASNRKLIRVNTEYQNRISEMPDFTMDEVDFFKLLGINVIFLDENMRIAKISRYIPRVSNIKESDLGKYAGEINIINGYVGWSKDLAAAARGQRTIRILSKDNNRISVEIYPYFFSKLESSGYVVIIREIKLEDVDYGSEQ